MAQNHQNRKQSPLPAILIAGLVILSLFPSLLLILLPLLLIGVCIGVPVFITSKHRKKAENSDFAQEEIKPASTAYTSLPKKDSSHDWPDLFCTHRDKGLHHVRKGKEMDPWDRPDIDIRQYQHR